LILHNHGTGVAFPHLALRRFPFFQLVSTTGFGYQQADGDNIVYGVVDNELLEAEAHRILEGAQVDMPLAAAVDAGTEADADMDTNMDTDTDTDTDTDLDAG
jgi:hypothetical protein